MVNKKFLTKGISGVVLGAILSACGGGGSSGSTSVPITYISKKEAVKSIKSSGLFSSIQEGIDVNLSFSPVKEYTCDILGVYDNTGKKICVLYDSNETISGSPKEASNGVDYVLNIPKSKYSSEINDALVGLNNVKYLPVLSDENNKTLEGIVGEDLNGTFRIRNLDGSSCGLYDLNSTLSESLFSLESNGTNMWKIPSGIQVNTEGNYSLDCNLSNNDGTVERVLGIYNIINNSSSSSVSSSSGSSSSDSSSSSSSSDGVSSSSGSSSSNSSSSSSSSGGSGWG